MTDRERAEISESAPAATVLEFGGLRFEVSFREVGATLRLKGRVDGTWTELLRFDDFVDEPHFHAPASGDQIPFDRESLGEPLAWYVAQIRDHLAEWLDTAGFGNVAFDVETVSLNADRLTAAMNECVPKGFQRVPGVGLQRTERSA